MVSEPPERLPPRRSTSAILGMQFGMVLLAGLLALLFRIDLCSQLVFSVAAVNWSVIATLPLLLMVWALSDARWTWTEELRQLMQNLIVPLFRTAPAGTLFLVSLLAGVGEELLFRGVIQGGLSGLIGPWGGLVLASVLFGALHALTPAYFIIATLMGGYLGWIYLSSGNLLIPILIHFLYDWIVLRYLMDRQSAD